MSGAWRYGAGPLGKPDRTDDANDLSREVVMAAGTNVENIRHLLQLLEQGGTPCILVEGSEEPEMLPGRIVNLVKRGLQLMAEGESPVVISARGILDQLTMRPRSWGSTTSRRPGHQRLGSTTSP